MLHDYRLLVATVAVKETDLRGLPVEVQDILRREAEILDQCDHPNIVRLFQVTLTRSSMHSLSTHEAIVDTHTHATREYSNH